MANEDPGTATFWRYGSTPNPLLIARPKTSQDSTGTANYWRYGSSNNPLRPYVAAAVAAPTTSFTSTLLLMGVG